MTKAYPGMERTDIYQTLAVEHLCNGMPNPNMAFDVLTKKRQSIAQAIDMIERYECCKSNIKK